MKMNILRWAKPHAELEHTEVQEMYEELEPEISYNKYIIIFTLLHAGSLNQLQLECYFTNEEAYKAFHIINEKIGELVRTNSSVAMSLVARNKEREVIRHGISGIVGIEHNIPQFQDVLEE